MVTYYRYLLFLHLAISLHMGIKTVLFFPVFHARTKLEEAGGQMFSDTV